VVRPIIYKSIRTVPIKAVRLNNQISARQQVPEEDIVLALGILNSRYALLANNQRNKRHLVIKINVKSCRNNNRNVGCHRFLALTTKVNDSPEPGKFSGQKEYA
jgi:hypothetical protein